MRMTMVGVAAKGPACSTGGHTLVVAGDPTMSLLYGKLALTPACGESLKSNSSL